LVNEKYVIPFILVERNQLMNHSVYHTQQIMGAVWRGNIEPPNHIPDPAYDWKLPEFLADSFNQDGTMPTH
jgi:hypothetical protein